MAVGLPPWDRDGVTVLGVRHHSPTCALQVRRAIAALRPATVLIEGPGDGNSWIEALQDPALTAPVALFAFASWPDPGGGACRRFRGWYPFCDHSPELEAIRGGGAIGAEVRFCDLSFAEKLELADPALQQALAEEERDLFDRSERLDLVQALRTRFRVPDDEGVWEALFEGGAVERPWRDFFADTARWGAALRSTDGRPHRDACRDARMAAAAAAARERGPVVVVCGAFHVPGITAALGGAPAPAPPPLRPEVDSGIYLVPYRFDRMVQLRYAAGVPCPEWSQLVWEGEQDGVPPWVRMLAAAAAAARAADVVVSTADLMSAAEFAVRLSRFRGRPWPGRQDLVDAMGGCWVKGAMDSGHGAVLDVVMRALQGDRCGVVGPGAGDPQLVRAVDRALVDASLTAPPSGRTVRLSPARKARDRARMLVLLQLSWLGVAYGEQRAGPRFLEGTDLERVQQVWRLGWTPEDRSRLYEQAAYGATLEDACAALLREKIAHDEAGAGQVVRRLRQACALGLHGLVPALVPALGPQIDGDPRLRSVLAGLHGLHLLARYRVALGVAASGVSGSALLAATRRCRGRALWLIADLASVQEADEEDVIAGLCSLEHAAAALGDGPEAGAALLDALAGVRPELGSVPGVHGGVDGVLWRGGRVSTAAVRRDTLAWFRGEDPDGPGRFVGGLIGTVRRAYVDGSLLDGMDDGLLALDEEGFRDALPRLRRAHAQLTPAEARRLARCITRRQGGSAPSCGAGSAGALDAVRAAAPATAAWWAQLGLTLGAEPAPRRGDAGATSGVLVPEVHRAEGATGRELLCRRWRLVLGRPAAQVSPPLTGDDDRIDGAMGFLYDREYAAPGRDPAPTEGAGSGGRGGDEDSAVMVPQWLDDLGAVFSRSTAERLQAEALERYGLTDLVTRPEVLERCTPSLPLVEAILKLKGHMSPDVLQAARRIVRRVAADLARALHRDVQVSLSGRARHHQPRPRGRGADFDPRATIRRNMKHFNHIDNRMVVAQPWFRARTRRVRGWRLVLCVDQSASMLRSFVHAAVLASVFANVPALKTHLVIFDTAVVDLTDRCTDPVETLMSAQLGGGTNIGRAVGYCGGLVDQPRRTLLVLVSDLYEGPDPGVLLARVQALVEAGVTVLVLGALTGDGAPDYDRELGKGLAGVGAHVAAMSPEQLVAWVAAVIG